MADANKQKGNIFANAYDETQTISATGAVITWGLPGQTPAGIPLVMTSLDLQFSRGLTRIFPINTTGTDNAKKQLVIAGAPSGTLTCGGIITPDMGELQSFLEACGVTCTDSLPTVNVKPFGREACGSKENKTTTFVLYGVQLETINLRYQSSQQGLALVEMPLRFIFSNMKFDQTGT